MAWLHATPKDEKKDKRLSGDAKPKSRLGAIRDAGQVPDLPDNPASYLTEWLFEIGPTIPAGMGSAAIGWRDLSAWQEVVGIELEPWEARLLRRLSGDYLAQYHDAEAPDCPAPFTSKIEANRQAVASKVAAIFGSRVRKE